MNTVFEKGLVRIKWFVAAVIAVYAIVLFGSAPATAPVAETFMSTEFRNNLLFAAMFFLPLIALFLYLPVVRQLGRSLLGWGLGIVLVPLGPLVMGAALLYVGSRRVQAP